jgi:hypothetical protein
MRLTSFRSTIAAAALALVALAAPASAEVISLKADLKPAPGATSTASGSVTVQYDTDSNKLTWRGTYGGIATYATSAAFFNLGAGGGMVRIRDIDSPFEGTAILAAAQGASLAAGEWGIVIRTAGFPKGELLGKLTRN